LFSRSLIDAPEDEGEMDSRAPFIIVPSLRACSKTSEARSGFLG
jgi:hypothetical protein